MIDFNAFSDEMQKIAAKKYRAPSTKETWLGPENYLGKAVPMDPEERKKKYLDRTRWLVPAGTAAGGVAGAGHGMLAGSASTPKGGNLFRRVRWGGAIGGLAGAGLMAGGMVGLRHLVGNRMRQDAEDEALVNKS